MDAKEGKRNLHVSRSAGEVGLAQPREGWQRKAAWVDLQHAEIAALLRPAVGDGTILSAQPVSGGLVNTNLKGAWLVAREFAHHLVERKRSGRIINITSVLAFRTIGRVPAYCAAKAGLTHLTQVLAMELARHGILVNALAPGYVETDFNRAFFQTEPGKALISRIPLKRLGQTEDLDGALLFLASPASAYVTGAVIAVDGGHGAAAI